MHKIIAALLVSTSIVGTASARDAYVGVYGGANFNDVLNDPAVDAKTGFVVGSVIGTNVPSVPGLRIELDASYRTNDVKVAEPILLGSIDVVHDTTAILGNVVYDFPVVIRGGLQPYALVGLGVASTEATFENVSVLKLESTGVAWQAGAGLNWKVSDDVTAGVGYRYFQGPELQVLNNELSDGSNHSVVASVSFAL